MAGLFKGILKIATLGLYGGSNESQPETVVPQPPIQQQSQPTPASTPNTSNDPFDASHFWKSHKTYQDLSYHQLDPIEQDIIADITDYIDDLYDKHYDFEEATHITLNKRLDYLELCFKDGAKKFQVVKDNGKWDVYDDEAFWKAFGEGDEIEDVYIPPN